jgi:hypothetical protein
MRRDKFICTGKGGFISSNRTKAESFKQFLLGCSTEDQWLIDTVNFPWDLDILVHSIKQGEAIVV